MLILLCNKHHALGRGQRALLRVRRRSFVILDEFFDFSIFFLFVWFHAENMHVADDQPSNYKNVCLASRGKSSCQIHFEYMDIF